MLPELYEALTKRIPFTRFELIDGEVKTRNLAGRYYINYLEERSLFMMADCSKRDSIFFEDIEQICLFFEEREASEQARKEDDIFSQLRSSFKAISYTATKPITPGTLVSISVTIPHKKNNWLKKLIGTNEYIDVIILYNYEESMYSISTHDKDGKFLMLGMTSNFYGLCSLIAPQLKAKTGFEVIGTWHSF